MRKAARSAARVGGGRTFKFSRAIWNNSALAALLGSHVKAEICVRLYSPLLRVRSSEYAHQRGTREDWRNHSSERAMRNAEAWLIKPAQAGAIAHNALLPSYTARAVASIDRLCSSQDPATCTHAQTIRHSTCNLHCKHPASVVTERETSACAVALRGSGLA